MAIFAMIAARYIVIVVDFMVFAMNAIQIVVVYAKEIIRE